MPDKTLFSLTVVITAVVVVVFYWMCSVIYEQGYRDAAVSVMNSCEDTGRFYSGYRVYNCGDLEGMLGSYKE